jgi:hypothetical protein
MCDWHMRFQRVRAARGGDNYGHLTWHDVGAPCGHREDGKVPYFLLIFSLLGGGRGSRGGAGVQEGSRESTGEA